MLKILVITWKKQKADIKMYIIHSVRKTCWSRAKPQEEL